MSKDTFKGTPGFQKNNLGVDKVGGNCMPHVADLFQDRTGINVGQDQLQGKHKVGTTKGKDL